MRRELPGGYVLDDDPARIDVEAAHAYLANESYWAKDRPLEVVAASIAGSARVIGLYHDGAQVGLARVVSDDATQAYLADVYVLEPHRGHGLGRALVEEAVERGAHANLKWLLHTADAHALYRELGFDRPSERVMERSRR